MKIEEWPLIHSLPAATVSFSVTRSLCMRRRPKCRLMMMWFLDPRTKTEEQMSTPKRIALSHGAALFCVGRNVWSTMRQSCCWQIATKTDYIVGPCDGLPRRRCDALSLTFLVFKVRCCVDTAKISKTKKNWIQIRFFIRPRNTFERRARRYQCALRKHQRKLE